MESENTVKNENASASEVLEYLSEVVMIARFVIGLGFSLYAVLSRPCRIPNFIERGLQE